MTIRLTGLMKPENFGAATVDLSQVEFTPELLEYLPAEAARKYRVMPVADSPFHLVIAVADASDLNALDSIMFIVNREMEIRVADKSQLDEYIRRYYGSDGGVFASEVSPTIL